MKRGKQWKTASKWRRLCHQAGQLILYMLKPSEVNVSNTIQKRIAIIETTGHESSSEQFCTIQIKVTANTPQVPHMVKTWATDCWYMWTEGAIAIKYYTKIPSRFSRVSLDTEKLNRKHTGIFSARFMVLAKPNIWKNCYKLNVQNFIPRYGLRDCCMVFEVHEFATVPGHISWCQKLLCHVCAGISGNIY